MKRFALAAMTATLMSSGAYAADVFGGGSTKDAPAFSETRVVNWTGFYIGGQAGYGKSQHNLDVIRDEQVIQSIDGLGGDGFIGGGRVGFDVARGRFLFGLFGEYNWSNVKTEFSNLSLKGDGNDLKDNDGGYSLEKENEWSVGARAGVIAAPRTLVYVLAAYTQSEYNLSGLTTSDASEGWSGKKTLQGVSVGAGVEYALTGNVFLGLEGVYTAYGDEKWHDGRNPEGEGRHADIETDELRVMGTLKIKLNSDIGRGFID